jgi:hypothetical protein
MRPALVSLAIGSLVSVGCGGGEATTSSGAGGEATAASSVATTGSTTASTSATGGSGGAPDLDHDGLTEVAEQVIAEGYLPYLSVDPGDGCPLAGIVYRVRPHPSDGTKIHIVYDVLYQNDCGANGHIGDDEVFAITVDPMVLPPAGIVAIRAIGHQGTPCEVVTECGSCPGLTACATATTPDGERPVVYPSKDKHANYADLSKCTFVSCLASCTTAPSAPVLPMVNLGEPGFHLISNLTSQGFITPQNGWTEMSLFDFDPWDAAKNFGGAGNIASDLDDAAFLTPVCSG